VFVTIDRKSLRDIGLAVLLALPTAALTRPAPAVSDRFSAPAASHVQLALAERSAPQRFSLPG
jgi:hypothetical protein